MTTHLVVTVDGLEQPEGLNSNTFSVGWRVDEPLPRVPDNVLVTVRTSDPATEWVSAPTPFYALAVQYQGPPLLPMSDYVIEVKASSAAEPLGFAAFNSGKILQTWQASWIGRSTETFKAARALEMETLRPRSSFDRTRSWRTTYNSQVAQLRKTFELHGEVATARLVISAQGIYRAYVNGTRIGDQELAPGWTSYEDRIFYQNYDIQGDLVAGTNSIGVELADGWWSGGLSYDTRVPAQHYGSAPALIAEIHITYRSGEEVVVATDGTWYESPGEIQYADLLMGELHDFTCATDGWLAPEYRETPAWEPVVVVDASKSVLSASDRVPVRVVRMLEPVDTRLHNGKLIVDFGQNFAGRVRLRLRSLARGSTITIRHGEVLDGDGNLYTKNLRSAEATDIAIASGADEEEFEPRFTFHGFRYIEVHGLTQPLAPGDLVADVLSSDLRSVLEFRSGNQLVNSLYSNIDWGLRSNFVSVPTDCPQRDERLGWSADVQVFAPTASYLTDSAGFLRSWLVDFASSQEENGQLPDVAPKPPRSENFNRGAPAWGDAITILPWHLYEQTGDIDMLAQFYPHMLRWVDYVLEANPNGIWENHRGNDYGDWLSVDETTPKELIATSYLANSVSIVARASAILAELEDESRLLAARTRITAAYLDRYIADGRLKEESQTGYALALHFQLIPEALRGNFGSRLAALIESRGQRLTTGFLGISVLAPTLSSIGRSDLAFDLLLQTEFPSWGYSISHGATTIWERWDAWTEHAGFQSAEMNSFNHYSLGSVGAWMIGNMAGIRQSEGSVGYRSLLIAPEIDERVGWIDVAYATPFGQVRSAWRVEKGTVHLVIDIPVGQPAHVVCGPIDSWVQPGSHSWTFEYEPARESGLEMVEK